MYEVYLEHAAEKDLRRLRPKIFHHLVEHIEALAKNPRPVGCRKIVDTKDDWRIRVGNYRVIYEINDGAQMVRIMRVRYRRAAYR